MFKNALKRSWFRRLCLTVAVSFAGNIIGWEVLQVNAAYAQDASAAQALMPPPGKLLVLSQPFAAPELKAISVDPADPFKINFLVNAADEPALDGEQMERLAKYFLTFLTVPQKDLWVNLSPFESDRILNPDLESTAVGRDLLIEDYVLKQMAASMTYPEREPGATFWKQVLAKAGDSLSSTGLARDIFRKVWVVPEKAKVYEHKGVAFIAESRLKVLLEKDYLASKLNGPALASAPATRDELLQTQLLKEIILPELEREVNEGRYFAPLRQMFHSLILAIWFKQRLKENLVNRVYADQNKITGIDIKEKDIKERIYEQYLQAVKQGVYNYIREDKTAAGQLFPRKYFSGGMVLSDNPGRWLRMDTAASPAQLAKFFQQTAAPVYRYFQGAVSLLPKGTTKTLLAMAVAATVLAPVSSAAGEQSRFVKGPVAISSQTQAPSSIQSTPRVKKSSAVRRAPLRRMSDAEFNVFKDIKSKISPEQVAAKFRLTPKQQAYLTANWERIFDSKMKGAFQIWSIKTFQGLNGLAQDGIAGPLTAEKVQGKQMSQKADLPSSVKMADLADSVKAKPQQADAAGGSPAVKMKSVYDPNGAAQTPHGGQGGASGAGGSSNAGEGSSPQEQGARKASGIPTPDGVVRVQSDGKGGVRLSGSGVSLVPDRITIVAGAEGVLRNFNPEMTAYSGMPHREAKIADVLNAKMSADMQAARSALALAREDRDRKAQMLKDKTGTLLEWQRAEALFKVRQEQLAQVEERLTVQSTRTQYTIKVRRVNLSNGSPVQPDTPLLEGDNLNVLNLTFRVPGSVPVDGQIHMTLNGSPVHVAGMTLREIASSTEMEATLTLVSEKPVSGPARIEGVIRPPTALFPQLAEINGNSKPMLGTWKDVHRLRLITSRAGNVTYFVRPGDFVRAGQLVFEIQGSHEILDEIRLRAEAYNVLQGELDAVSTRVRGIPTEVNADKDRIRSQMDSLLAGIKERSLELANLRRYADRDGVVTRVGQINGPKGALAVEIATREATIGSAESPENSPTATGTPLREGSPILVMTAGGMRVPGRVITVNSGAGNRRLRMLDGPQTSYEIFVPNTGLSAAEGAPVNIIIPNDAERPKVLAALAQAEQSRANEMRQAEKSALVPPLPLKYQPLRPAQRLPLSEFPLTPNRGPLRSFGTPLSLDQVRQKVSGNDILNGPMTRQVLAKEEEAKMVNQTKVTLQGNLFVQGGKLLFGGGLSAIFRGLLGGGVVGGNAYAAAANAVIGTFWTHISDLLTDKPEKVQKWHDTGVEATRWAFKAAISANVQAAESVYVNIGAAQRKIQALEAAKTDLKTILSELTERAKAGESTYNQVRAVEKQIEGIETSIAKLQQDLKKRTMEANAFMMVPLPEMFSVELPFDGRFRPIETSERHQMQATLLAKSYDIRQAEEERKQMEETVKLQELGLLPRADLTGLIISRDSGPLNPMRDLTNGARLRTTAAIAPVTAGFGLEIDLYDSAKDPWQNIMRIQREAAGQRVLTAGYDGTKRLELAIEGINLASAEINRLRKLYERGIKDWQVKVAQKGVRYNASELNAERLHLLDLERMIIDHEGRYFLQEATLRQLNVLEGTLITPPDPDANTFSVNAHVAKPPDVVERSSGRLLVVPQTIQDIVPPRLSGLPTAGPQWTAGVAKVIPLGNSDQRSATRLWLIQKGASVDANPVLAEIQKNLNSDNDSVRAQTLHELFTRYSSYPQFNQVVEQGILNNNHPEIVQELLSFIANGKDDNIAWLLHVIDQAYGQAVTTGISGTTRVRWGFEAMADLFRRKQAQPWTEERLFPLDESRESSVSGAGKPLPETSRETSRLVMASFLMWAMQSEPILAEQVIRSYWDLDALAAMKDALDQAEPKTLFSQHLSTALGQEVERRAALARLPDFRRRISKGTIKMDLREDYRAEMFQRENHTALMKSSVANQIDLLPAELFQAAADDAKAVFARSRGLIRFPKLYPVPVDYNDPANVGWLTGLGPDEQAQSVAQAKTQGQLGRLRRMFVSGIGAASQQALDALMQTQEGMFAVLSEYVTTKDDTIKKQIESRDWVHRLRSLEPRSTAETLVLRQASAQMYDRSNQAPRIRRDFRLMNAGLMTYNTYAEVRAAQDPRGKKPVEDQLRRKAIELAMDYAKYVREHKVRLETNNQNFYKAEETAALAKLSTALKEADFHKVEKVLEDMKALEIGKEISDAIPGFEDDLRRNDQDTSSRPLTWYILPFFAGLLGVIGLFRWGFIEMDWFWDRYFPMDPHERFLRTHGVKFPNIFQKMWRNFKKRHISSDQAMLNEQYKTSRKPIPASVKIRPHLENWQTALDVLTLNSTANEVLTAVNSIMDSIGHIIRATPFSADLISKVKSPEELNGKMDDIRDADPTVLNGEYIQAFRDSMSHLAAETVFFVVEYVKGNPKAVTAKQRQNLAIQMHRLSDRIVPYLSKYSSILDRRANINMVVDHMYPKNHPLERPLLDWPIFRHIPLLKDIRIYPLIRDMQGQNYLRDHSQSLMWAEIEELGQLGNDLVEGLYPDIQSEINRGKWRLNNVIQKVISIVPASSPEQDAKNRFARFATRAAMEFVPLLMLVGWWVGVPTLTALGMLSTLISHYWHWDRHLRLLKIQYVKEWKTSWDSWKASMDLVLGPATSQRRDNREWIRLERRRKVPSFDLTVLIPRDSNKMEQVVDFVAQKKTAKSLFHDNAWIEVIPKQRPGSANSIFEAVRFAKQKLMEMGRTFENSKVLLVPVPDGVPSEHIQDAIVDGLKLVSRKAGGQVVLSYAQNRIEAPAPPDLGAAHMKIYSVKGTEKDIKEGVVRRDEQGKFKGTFEMLDLDELKNKAGDEKLAEMKRRINPDLKEAKQYDVFSGRLVIEAEGIAILSQVSDVADEMLPDDFPAQFLRDFMNPAFYTDRHNYSVKRWQMPDVRNLFPDQDHRRKVKDQVEAFYEMIGQVVRQTMQDRPLEAPVYAYNPWDANVTIYSEKEPLRSRPVLVKMKRGQRGAGSRADRSSRSTPLAQAGSVNKTKNPAMRVGRNAGPDQAHDQLGGMDLSKTQSILGFSQGSSKSSKSTLGAGVIPDLRAFRGFGFKLLEFRPLSNPIEFFPR